jgi:putative transposase
MMTSARARYAGYQFPVEIISHAVWLYFRFPLGLRMVEELLAARGIIVSHETVRQWARKFGQPFASRIRRRLPRIGDKPLRLEEWAAQWLRLREVGVSVAPSWFSRSSPSGRSSKCTTHCATTSVFPSPRKL